MIIRNDDVNFNTNGEKLKDFYNLIHEILPHAVIWSAVTVFSEQNNKGSVYPCTPFKDNDVNWFYKAANRVKIKYGYPSDCPWIKTASHGLFHIDHSKVSRQTQEMSILGSCAYLKSKIFVPPFNRYNQETIDICIENGIEIRVNGWLSMEFNPFDGAHPMWYLHSWKFSEAKLKDYFNEYLRSSENSAELGQLQKPSLISAARI